MATVGLSDTTIEPAQYWAVIKNEFEKAKIDAGDVNHNCLMVGQFSINSWNLTYGGITSRPLKAMAEGRGGWNMTTHLMWSMNWATRGQGLWDLLGLGDGSGSDFIEGDRETLMTTPEGKYSPINTAAFIAYINSELGASETTYAGAVALLDALEADPVNQFYDKATAVATDHAFSMKAYQDRYKTLASDGTTRLIVGSTAGTKVTTATDWDVCVPTHIILQHSHNDGDVAWVASNYRIMTDAIKAEYTAQGWGTVNIAISIIGHTGTYYPKRYPMFDRASVSLWSHAPSVGINNYEKVVNEFWVDDANEDTERIFILPSLQIQPPAWSTPFRRLPTPEFDITGIIEHNYLVIDGAGPDWHPNAIAHRVWGLEIYAWIRYTLSL